MEEVQAPLRILAVDVGTGTQDILLFESDRSIENCLQLVMPSPTVIVAERIRRASAAGQPVLLTGHTMGGGPAAWAARDHAQAGLPCYATPDAARTLDDDLAAVEALGLRVIGEEDVERVRATEGARLVEIVLRDLDVAALATALGAFGVDPAVDVIAIAAFDHGAAPPGYSDRAFRFDHIREIVGVRPDPLAFAYRANALPADLTRLRAVAADAAGYPARVDTRHAAEGARHAPLQDVGPMVVVMDTGAAAAVGALEDPVVRAHDTALLANIGNFHTLAFLLHRGRIRALFEHHTGELDCPRLEGYLRALAAGTLDNQTIFDDSGHGALTLDGASAFSADGRMPFLAVTGPRRELLRGGALAPYEAVPHGDMMLAGCYGLLRAVAALHPEHAAAIEGVLGPVPFSAA
ncbi:MAG TPA: DUF1786 family protein [Ktedonobacterales bacterium]|nr:DUF1786 family protein [Ktedonobacterales bacterium]